MSNLDNLNPFWSFFLSKYPKMQKELSQTDPPSSHNSQNGVFSTQTDLETAPELINHLNIDKDAHSENTNALSPENAAEDSKNGRILSYPAAMGQKTPEDSHKNDENSPENDSNSQEYNEKSVKNGEDEEKQREKEAGNEGEGRRMKRSRQIGKFDWWEIDDANSEYIYFFNAKESKTYWDLPTYVLRAYCKMPVNKVFDVFSGWKRIFWRNYAILKINAFVSVLTEKWWIFTVNLHYVCFWQKNNWSL